MKAVERIERASDLELRLSESSPEDWSHRILMLCDAYLAAGEARRADAVLAGRRWRVFNPAVLVAVDHANGRAVSDAEMAWLRYRTGGPQNGPSDLRLLARMEARQARLTGRRSSLASPTSASPDELWAAVLRDRR